MLDAGATLMRVAVASDDGVHVRKGHFICASHFLIYDVEEGEARFLGSRENLISMMFPEECANGDYPAIARLSEEAFKESRHRGAEAFSALRDKVLDDVDVLVTSYACFTSLAYLLSNEVKTLLAEPEARSEAVVGLISKIGYERLPYIAVQSRDAVLDIEVLIGM